MLKEAMNIWNRVTCPFYIFIVQMMILNGSVKYVSSVKFDTVVIDGKLPFKHHLDWVLSWSNLNSRTSIYFNGFQIKYLSCLNKYIFEIANENILIE